MSTKASPPCAQIVQPPLGTIIDQNLELVEVLGVGGYGIVYRAVDIISSFRKSYAVKCLPQQQSERQRRVQIREITLHRLASAHPGVVSLHRVVEEDNHTYIIMDYAPDHDLFTQILHSCRYLSDDALIKHVFLQLLDAVEYCHSLGIYHRDLKPENILCFDDGLRVAITDFGLATTEKLSEEFRTGSIYHMSPECQGGELAITGNYSPMFNDIWSLGIILLNLATGRNPWKSATPDDPTFQAYLVDPLNFLPNVLPISPELNDVLVRMLEIDWRERITIKELRFAINNISTFYSKDAVFDASMARCPWEVGREIESDSSAQDICASNRSEGLLKSHWSKDSGSSNIVFATQSVAEESSYGALWTDYSSCAATWAFESDHGSDLGEDFDGTDIFAPPRKQPSQPLPPNTPNNLDLEIVGKPDLKALTIYTNLALPQYYGHNASMRSISGSSMVQTAVDRGAHASSFLFTSPSSPLEPPPLILDTANSNPSSNSDHIDADESPSGWLSSTEVSSPSSYSPTTSSIVSCDLSFIHSSIVSPDTPQRPHTFNLPLYPQRKPSQNPLPHSPSPPTEDLPISSSPPKLSFFSSKKSHDGKSRTSSIFNPIKFFPRPSTPSSRASSPTPPLPKPSTNPGRRTSEPTLSSFACSKIAASPPSTQRWTVFAATAKAHPPPPAPFQEQRQPSPVPARSFRYWFMPKFFSMAAH